MDGPSNVIQPQIGGSMDQRHISLFNDLLRALALYRGLVIDAVEPELSSSPTWPYVRTRLLNCFGQRGLEGRIREIFGVSTSAKETGL